MDDPNDREVIDDEVFDEELEGEREDARRLDDEGGDETEAGQEPEAAQAQEGLGRASKRIQALRREAQEERERAALLQRELEAERARVRQPAQSTEESDDAFNARLALMDDPEKRLVARIERSEKRHQRELLITRMQAADAADKASFTSKAAYDPRYKKYADRVEQVLAEERRNGRDYPRETVLRFVLGEAVINSKGKSTQRQDAAARVQRQQARADSGRSDVSGQRQRQGQGNSLADLEKRLDGVYI